MTKKVLDVIRDLLPVERNLLGVLIERIEKRTGKKIQVVISEEE